MDQTKYQKKCEYDRYANWLYAKLAPTEEFDGTSQRYFITLSFNQYSSVRQRRITEGYLDKNFEFDGFNLLYNRICRQLIGRNYSRTHNQPNLPTAIACIDVEGTRFWKSAGEIQNKHIHSVWKIRKQDQQAFEALINSQEFQSKLRDMIDLDGFDIQEIADQSELKRVISYSSKFLKFNEKEILVEEDLRVYPLL